MEKLTEQEIKIINGEKRIAYVFSLLIFFAGALCDFTYYLINGINSVFIVVAILILSLCILVPYLMNRNYNKDIQLGSKIVEIGCVQDKESEDSYEAGSGNLYIPILGNLSSKLWGSHPRHSLRCYLTVNNIRYRTEEEIYNKANIGDEIEMYFTPNSHYFIGFGKCS